VGFYNMNHACMRELTAASDEARLLEGRVKVSVGCVVALEMEELPI